MVDSQAAFEAHCARSDAPCLLLLGSAEHQSVMADAARHFSGEVVVVASLDTEGLPAAANALGVGVPSAVFIGPLTKRRLITKKLPKKAGFSLTAITTFVRSALSQAADSVREGEAVLGLRTIKKLPMLVAADQVTASDEEEEEEEDGDEYEGKVRTGRRKKRGARVKSEKASPFVVGGLNASSALDFVKARPTADQADGSRRLVLLKFVTKACGRACTNGDSWYGAAAEELATMYPDGGGAIVVRLGRVKLPASELHTFGLDGAAVPAYALYREGVRWPWDPQLPRRVRDVVEELRTQVLLDQLQALEPAAINSGPIADIPDGDVRAAVADDSVAVVVFMPGPSDIDPGICADCAVLQPELERAARLLHREKPTPIRMLRVDAARYSALQTEFELDKLPALYLFANGDALGAVTVSARRSQVADSIVNLARQWHGGPTKEISSLDDAQNLIKYNTNGPRPLGQVTVVGFFGAQSKPEPGSNATYTPAELAAAFECYKSVATLMSRVALFLHTFSDDIRRDPYFGYPAGSLAVIKAPHVRSEYELSATVTDIPMAMAQSKELGVSSAARDLAIQSFVLENVMPLVGEMTPKNFDMMYRPNLPVVIGFTSIDWFGAGTKATQFWRKRMVGAARGFVGNISFAMADSATYSSFLSTSRLDDHAPTEFAVAILTVDPDDSTKVLPVPLRAAGDDATEGRIRSFVQSFLEERRREANEAEAHAIPSAERTPMPAPANTKAARQDKVVPHAPAPMPVPMQVPLKDGL